MKFFTKLLSFFALHLFTILILSSNVKAQTFPVDSVLFNGDPNKFINIVFMGDGYQQNELPSFDTAVQNTSNYLFKSSPFKEYKNYFNVFGIKVSSAESGADHPNLAPDCPTTSSHPVLSVNTYFNSTFDYSSIHRLLVPTNSSAINNVIINNFPTYDQKTMLVNSPYYGGSGGSTATASLNAYSAEIMVHEIGHSFANLADEYWAGNGYADEKANMTQQKNSTLVKWKNWIGTGGVGIYQYCCGGNSASWYRPHNSCKMQKLGQDFCPVCKETIALAILQKFGTPIASFLPNQSVISVTVDSIKFRINLYKPNPNTLRTKWFLNGKKIAMNVDSLTITSIQLIVGNNSISVQVLDTSSFIRADSHAATNTFSVNWTVCLLPLEAGAISGTATVCQGQNAVTYSVPAIKNATFYTWTLPGGAKGTSKSNSITINYDTSSISGIISVKGNNVCGDGAISTFAVIVNAKPSTPIISGVGSILHSDAPNGNQWYSQIGILNGAINQNYTVTANGDYYVIQTLSGCSSNESNIIKVDLTGIEIIDENRIIKIYPNPVSTELIIEMEGNTEKLNFEIVNANGQVVFKGNFIKKTTLHTNGLPAGIYLVKLENGKTFEFKKILKE